MCRHFSYGLYGVFVTFSFLGVLYADAEKSTRYAILASQETTDDGLLDLLTVKLADMERIELVERTEIEKVLQEISLSTLFDTRGIDERVKLGKILAADRLFVLQKIGTEVSRLHFQIIDTSTASILFQGDFDPYQGPTDETVDALSHIVATNSRNFHDGIKAIITVPPFLSKGVETKAETYQEQFSGMISTALLQRPGIAVVSFEEFEVIRRELDFSAQNLQRVVPLIVQGEFLPRRVNDKSGTNDFLFDIVLKLSDRSGVRASVEEKSLTRLQAVELLAVEVPRKIFSLLDDSRLQPAFLDEQEKILTESAERFHRYGMYQLAQKQRDAIILINPDNLYQRLSWIEEFYILHESDRRTAPGRDKVFAHLDYIIRNRQVTKSQGCSLMKFYHDLPHYWVAENGTFYTLNENEHPYYVPFVGLKHFFPMLCELPYDDEMTPADEDAFLPFFRPTHLTRPRFSFIYAKDFEHPGREKKLSRNDQDAILLDILYEYVIRCDVPQFQKESIDYLQEKIFKFPECWTIPDFLFSYYLPSPTDLNYRTNVYEKFLKNNAQQWGEFKNMLKNSHREDLLFLERFLNRLDGQGSKWQTGIQAERLAYVQELQEELREKNPDSKCERLNRYLDNARERLEASVAEEEREKQKLAKIIEKTKDVRSEHLLKLPLHLPVEGEIKVDAAFSVKAVPQWTEGQDVEAFYHETVEGKTVATTNIHKMLIPVPHDEKYDIAWNADCVFLCHMENGRLVRKLIYKRIPEKYASHLDLITRVRSDGRWIWIVKAGEIHCIDKVGNRIADFNTTCGLPDSRVKYGMNEHQANNLGHWNHELAMNTRYDNQWMLSVFPVGQDEAIAFGRSGNTGKTWIAKLTIDDRHRPHVKVLLNAPRDMETEELEKPGVVFDSANNDLIFNIPWVLKMDDPLFPERRQVLLGRILKASHTAPPFLIDLDTEEIMPVTERYPDLASLMGLEYVTCNNGHFVGYREFGLYSMDRDDKGIYHMTEHKIRYENEGREYATPHLMIHRRQCCNLLSVENNIYLTGPDWYRFDCSSLHGVLIPEKIAGTIVPDNACFKQYAQTVNFGLCSLYDLGFTSYQGSTFAGRLYQFDFTGPTHESFSPYTRYVPEEFLEKHCAAVTELESRGAIITGMPNNRLQRWPHLPKPASVHDRTYVIIDKSWKGTGRDFHKIVDLYHPRIIYFYDLELTDDYFHALDSADIEMLYFINAKFTNEQFELFDISKVGKFHFLYEQGQGPDDELISSIMKPRRNGSHFTGQIEASPHLFPMRRNETSHGGIVKLIFDAHPETYLE